MSQKQEKHLLYKEIEAGSVKRQDRLYILGAGEPADNDPINYVPPFGGIFFLCNVTFDFQGRYTYSKHPDHPTMTEREYNQCVDLYSDGVFRFIVKNLRHEEDARDIVQTAFEKLWRNREQVENAKSKSYLFTVAYNQMIDHLRKNKRVTLKEEFNAEAKVQHSNFSSNTRKILMEALNRLNETQKSLVMLKDYEGYTYEEIGKIMGLNESQVKVYLHRARLVLKEYLVSPENVL
jgi:RNA polymerase sigma factor (sigma-70 family)